MKKPEFIILIDDDEATNYYHDVIIQDSGIDTRVLSFEYAEKALDYFRSPDCIFVKEHCKGIIFLDINMPGMNGWDFLKEFENLPDHPKESITIFILTTSENPIDLTKAEKSARVKGFIMKPLTTELLNGIVDKHLSPISE